MAGAATQTELRQVALRGSFSEQVAPVTGPESLRVGHSRNRAEEEPGDTSSLGCANRNSIQLPFSPVGDVWDTCHLPGSYCGVLSGRKAGSGLEEAMPCLRADCVPLET